MSEISGRDIERLQRTLKGDYQRLQNTVAALVSERAELREKLTKAEKQLAALKEFAEVIG